MKGKSFQELYQEVPRKYREELKKFRENHPYKQIKINGIEWKYINPHTSKPNLLLLTGGTRIGESYILFPHLEKHFNVISPTYPFLSKLKDFIFGINKILEEEKINQTFLLGTSLGGIFAQEFVRRFPEKVTKLAIANTMSPIPNYVRRGKNAIRLLKILPSSLIRNITRKNLSRMWGDLKENERNFWESYIEDLVFNYMPKIWIRNQFEISQDYCLNYVYTDKDLENWKGEMIIIYSEEDKTFDLSIQRKLIALYPDAQVHEIKGAGHVPALKEKEKYLDILINFFGER